MLYLLSDAWPWILIGSLALAWGIISLGISLKSWQGLIMGLPFIFFTEETSEEKRLQKKPAEVVEENPGCGLFLLGIVMVSYGILRLIL